MKLLSTSRSDKVIKVHQLSDAVLGRLHKLAKSEHRDSAEAEYLAEIEKRASRYNK